MPSRVLATLAVVAACSGAGAPDPDVVTVHLVPHTHDDVGWLKTVDEYYSGQNNSIQHAYVKLVLDTVIRCLKENPDRTFTYVEQAFFQRWWRQQSEATKAATRELVKNGQLEFTNGGWCMHDEAAPFYVDMIDQTTLGHKFLVEEFGVSPSTGWQLDPFGHSATQAALLSEEVGFQGLFFGRIDYQDLAARVNASEAEFIWRASPSLGKDSQVFSGLTGEYGGNYGPPSGFNWNVNSNDEPIQDDPNLEDYNVESRINDFVKLARDQASHTRGKHIMWTMGSDFQYEAADNWYLNLDKLVKYANQDGRVRAVYSTPARYLAAKAQETDIAWPLKTDDFFPYADGPHRFWSGYFTSRPALKRYVRDSSAFLQVMRQYAVVAQSTPNAPPARKLPSDGALEMLEEAMGVAQHHDAVSGTAKQHVTFDYARRIALGRSVVVAAVSEHLARIAGVGASAAASIHVCDLRNVSVCAATQGVKGGIDFLVWNGLAQARNETVELPVPGSNFKVVDVSGQEVPSQVVPSLPSVTNYGADAGGSKDTLLFNADLPALGFKGFRLVEATAGAQPGPTEKQEVADDVLENEFLALQFCGGTLCRITDKTTGRSIKAEQSWKYYLGSIGNSTDKQASGAYIFRPNRTTAMPVSNATPSLTMVRGAVADEVHQVFAPWVSQRIRLAKGARHAEITYTVGPVPIDDGWGKEVVSRFSTDIQNAGYCYTDSNGREMLPRKRDYRPTWHLNQTEPVAGNYFPITTAAFIRDIAAKNQLTLLTDASEGGSGCVNEGELEMMVHRRLLKDDSRGVGEPLNETQFITSYSWSGPHGAHLGPGLVTRGRHLLTLNQGGDAAKVWRPLQDSLYMQPLPFFFPGASMTQAAYSVLAKPLPPNVQIITLTPWGDGEVLLRLAHQFGLDEDAALSQPATVDLEGLFTIFDIAQADERGLAAGISRKEVKARRIPWRVEGEAANTSAQQAPRVQTKTLAVTLGPLQVRTFILTPKAPGFVTFVV